MLKDRRLKAIKDFIITVVLMIPFIITWIFCIIFGCLYIGVEELKKLIEKRNSN